MHARWVIGRVGAELRAVARGDSVTHGRLRDTILVLLFATIGIDIVCSLLALLFEGTVRGSQVRGYGTALFWTTTQLLTVSSQMPNPVTTGGRILDVAMEAYAITVVATLAGSMGAFLMRRGRELDGLTPVAVRDPRRPPST